MTILRDRTVYLYRRIKAALTVDHIVQRPEKASQIIRRSYHRFQELLNQASAICDTDLDNVKKNLNS